MQQKNNPLSLQMNEKVNQMRGLHHRELGVVGAAYLRKTDSMRAKFLAEGEYELGGQRVVVQNGQSLLEDGTLAGSVLKMVDAVKNVMAYTGCSLQEAIQMSSSNPAKQLGVFDRKGSLKEGKDADIVILDENHDVFMTFCKGELAYQKGSENNESD